MATRASSLFNMSVTLIVITLVASLSLGYVYRWTKAPIEKAQLEKQLRAISAVVSGYDNDPVSESFWVDTPDGEDSLQFFPATKGGKLIGTAVKTYSPRGYSGDITLMVGFDNSGNILNIQVLAHAETPGLGSKMSLPPFLNQYIRFNPGTKNLKVKKDGGDIDAISGATITSRAFSEAVQLAYNTFINKTNGQ
jgi:electron transport complex protein RnfG